MVAAVRVYAFDVDETLEVSAGPIPVAALAGLAAAGHIVGLCGNWAALVRARPDWHRWTSFLGPMSTTKADYLRQLRQYIPADDYVMVGNILGVTGASDDAGAAAAAGWRFLAEAAFAAGAR